MRRQGRRRGRRRESSDVHIELTSHARLICIRRRCYRSAGGAEQPERAVRIERNIRQGLAINKADELLDAPQRVLKSRDPQITRTLRAILKSSRALPAGQPQRPIGCNSESWVVVLSGAAKERRVLNLTGGVEDGQYHVGAPLGSKTPCRHITVAVRAARTIERISGCRIIRVGRRSDNVSPPALGTERQVLRDGARCESLKRLRRDRLGGQRRRNNRCNNATK